MNVRPNMKRTLLCLAATVAITPLLSGRILAEASSERTTSETELQTVTVTAERETRSTVTLSGEQMQKLLPGVNPIKAVEMLPGVVFETSDPWGNNEQNESLVIHGFTTQQLGYTMDGIPLGDQQYGNYNGLSPTRALSSENVRSATLSSGAGALGVASTSNLGGAIEVRSRDPAIQAGIDVRETVGSYSTTRTFLRGDTGDLLGGARAYVSLLHHSARAWDFDGRQGGDQLNAKLIDETELGRLTLFFDISRKIEPNEDATSFGSQQTATSTYLPYTRPYLYPNYAAGLAYLTNGAPPAQYGNNFSNYFSAAQREDTLGYIQYDWAPSTGLKWSNQLYAHANSGRGIVAGPVNQAGLPGLFSIYFPGQNLVQTFGGTGYEVRTTEYGIHRIGERSTLNFSAGQHEVEAGLWYEHNLSSQARRWYPFAAANNDLRPYDQPRGPLFTQYDFHFTVNDLQLHLQDQWRITSALQMQAGWKSSRQDASNVLPVQQQNLATTNPPVNYPVGSITTSSWWLPQLGLIWDLSATEHIFVNAQKNMRQIVPYGAGSNFYAASPWSLGSQAAFESFKQTARPETSWTYDIGLRSRHSLEGNVLTGIEGQVNYYRVNFANRLFNVATFNFINPNPAILVNVGGVTTSGVDLALTLLFGEHFRVYNAASYNRSSYDDDYSTVSGAATVAVPIHGKQVPLTPEWLNKTVIDFHWNGFDAELSGDYVGRRFVTYTNDLAVAGNFLLGAQLSYTMDRESTGGPLKLLKFSLNGTNLADRKGISTAVVTGASGGYQAYPVPPTMVFASVEAGF